MDKMKKLLKLRKMSSREVMFRLRQEFKYFHEKRKMAGKPFSEQAEIFIPKYLLKKSYYSKKIPPERFRFYCFANETEELRQAYKIHFSSNISKVINQADNLLEHKFHLLGKDFQLGRPILWNQNPESGKVYPMKHYRELRGEEAKKYGDVKYVWELNRHQFFIDVAKAYFISGNEKYANCLKEWLETWIEQNPYKIGINHTSALEHAVRVYSWIWSYYFTKESVIWSGFFLNKFLRQLILHGMIIQENLSYYFSPYNHLVGELSALTLLGEFLSDFSCVYGWDEKYWNELVQQIDFQFHEDGFTVEQASYYHHFTLGFYLQNLILRQMNGKEVSRKVLLKTEKAVEAAMHLMRPDGHWPMLGDIDSARSIYFYPPYDMWNLKYMQAVGAVLFGREDFRFVAGELPEEVLWLFGIAGVDKFLNMTSKPPANLVNCLPKSGYWVFRDNWSSSANYLLMDIGEIAHGVHQDETPSAAHGHADILSFELCLKGKPVIVDPGFHNYFGDLNWHRYFRSTKGHNLVEVEGSGQARHEGRISWSRVATPGHVRLLEKSELKMVRGEINRFADIPETVRQRRYWFYRPGRYFLLIDQIWGEETAPLDMQAFLHFAPGECSWRYNQIYWNEKNICYTLLPFSAIVEVENGGKGCESGWICKGYGHKTAAPVMKIYCKSKLPTFFAYLFPVTDKITGFSWIESEKGLPFFTIAMVDEEEKIRLNPEQCFSVFDANWDLETDAEIVLQLSNEIYLYNLKCLKVKNKIESVSFEENSSLRVRLIDEGPIIREW